MVIFSLNPLFDLFFSKMYLFIHLFIFFKKKIIYSSLELDRWDRLAPQGYSRQRPLMSLRATSACRRPSQLLV